jgi:hypothetical protein
LFEFNNEYDIVIGCSVDINTEGVNVYIKLERLFKELTFGETKLSKFGNNKKALYLKDNE